jgi:hypothetical protein
MPAAPAVCSEQAGVAVAVWPGQEEQEPGVSSRRVERETAAPSGQVEQEAVVFPVLAGQEAAAPLERAVLCATLESWTLPSRVTSSPLLSMLR